MNCCPGTSEGLTMSCFAFVFWQLLHLTNLLNVEWGRVFSNVRVHNSHLQTKVSMLTRMNVYTPGFKTLRQEAHFKIWAGCCTLNNVWERNQIYDGIWKTFGGTCWSGRSGSSPQGMFCQNLLISSILRNFYSTIYDGNVLINVEINWNLKN